MFEFEEGIDGLAQQAARLFIVNSVCLEDARFGSSLSVLSSVWIGAAVSIVGQGI